MYHGISENEPLGGARYYDIRTTPQRFAEHAAWLRAAGRRVIDLEQAVTMLASPTPPSGDFAVITFDDGYRSVFTHALPVLQQNGMTAAVFLPTDCIADERVTLKGEACMTWKEAAQLLDAGLQVGSHTVTHRQVHGLSAEEIRTELHGSKAAIENALGVTVTAFSYPYAIPEPDISFLAEMRNLLQECGYQCAVTTAIGRASVADDAYLLPRLPMNTWDDHRLFMAKLDGGYDWLHALQYACKVMKLAAQRMRSVP